MANSSQCAMLNQTAPLLATPVESGSSSLGIRAVDDRSGTIFVQIDQSLKLLKFPAPPYPQLYGKLTALGFRVLGAEFITDNKLITAPDWWIAAPLGNFVVEPERQAWTEIRHQAQTNGKPAIAEVSRRCTSYIGLLSIRLLLMSTAYSDCYRAYANRKPVNAEQMFDNTFVTYIEAAIHAFFSDAAAFRDFLAEFVWKYVLHETETVTSYSRFLKRVSHQTSNISDAMLAAGEDGGWIKRLTDLRNDIIHVAPIGSNHPFPPCIGCLNPIQGGGIAVSMKYALVPRSLETHKLIDDALTLGDENVLKQQISIHKDLLTANDDALEYAWKTIGDLIDLAQSARQASGLQGSMLHLTDKDIIGPITVI